MRYAPKTIAAATFLALTACGSSSQGDTAADDVTAEASPTPVEYNKTCDAIRADIINLASERGVNIVKIYEPVTVEDQPKSISCTGTALVASGQRVKIYFRAYADQEGDRLVEYSEKPFDK